MVYFNQNELEYIQRISFKTANDLRNISKQNGEYRNYLLTVARSQIKDIKYIIVNFDKVNKEEKINNIVSNVIYYLSGMDNLSESDKRKELRRRIKNKQKVILYTKILDSLNEVM